MDRETLELYLHEPTTGDLCFLFRQMHKEITALQVASLVHQDKIIELEKRIEQLEKRNN